MINPVFRRSCHHAFYMHRNVDIRSLAGRTFGYQTQAEVGEAAKADKLHNEDSSNLEVSLSGAPTQVNTPLDTSSPGHRKLDTVDDEAGQDLLDVAEVVRACQDLHLNDQSAGNQSPSVPRENERRLKRGPLTVTPDESVNSQPSSPSPSPDAETSSDDTLRELLFTAREFHALTRKNQQHWLSTHQTRLHLLPPTTLSEMAHQAEFLISKNDLPAALPIYSLLHAIQHATFGASHPSLIPTTCHLADIYADLEQYVSAERHYLLAIELQRAYLCRGSSSSSGSKRSRRHHHLEVLRNMKYLARAYALNGKHDEAAGVWAQLVRIHRSIRGVRAVETVQCLEGLRRAERERVAGWRLCWARVRRVDVKTGVLLLLASLGEEYWDM